MNKQATNPPAWPPPGAEIFEVGEAIWTVRVDPARNVYAIEPGHVTRLLDGGQSFYVTREHVTAEELRGADGLAYRLGTEVWPAVMVRRFSTSALDLFETLCDEECMRRRDEIATIAHYKREMRRRVERQD